MLDRFPWLRTASAMLYLLPLLLFAAAFAGSKTVSIFKRAFSRMETRPPEGRPKGYRWGYFYIIIGALGTLTYGALVALSLWAPSAGVALPNRDLPLTTFDAALYGAIMLAATVGALIRRRPFFYLLVVLGEVASLAVNVLTVVVNTTMLHHTSYVLRSLTRITFIVCWLAYFGNRRHMFGYLRDEPAPLAPADLQPTATVTNPVRLRLRPPPVSGASGIANSGRRADEQSDETLDPRR